MSHYTSIMGAGTKGRVAMVNIPATPIVVKEERMTSA